MGDGADDAQRRAEAEREDEGAGPEVRPSEFSQGIAAPVASLLELSAEVVDELRKPLDPNRVRRREGRGRTQFEYLAGHDVKRRANEIFGFGNWGYDVLELVEIGMVPVKNERNGNDGWHVSYRATVRVTVRGCLPFTDVGYGDGVEYTPAARLTACELATKEAVTDAIKRAFTGWGDQFGLILYAKEDEKKRIASDENSSTATVARRDGPRVETPKTWAEIASWAEPYGETLGWREWVLDAAEVMYGTRDWAALTTNQRDALGQKAAGAIIALRDSHEPDVFPPPSRDEVRAAWSHVLGPSTAGEKALLPGPPWRMGPEEDDREPLGGSVPPESPETNGSPSEPSEAPETAGEPAREPVSAGRVPGEDDSIEF